jgi:hypothetical protein
MKLINNENKDEDDQEEDAEWVMVTTKIAREKEWQLE